MQNPAWLLVLIGLILVAIGAIWILAPSIPWLGKLPGDIPGYQIHVTWVREEMEGNVYHWAERDMEGWLCPALMKYFDEAPKEIYFQAKPSQ